MQSNTKRPPASMGEQWHPTPARLTRAIMEAPTPKRRQWAIEYRTMWEIAFHKASRGEPVRLRELLAWSGSTNKDRASAAREDAVKSWAAWEGQEANRTDLGQESDRNRTEVSASKVDSGAGVGNESETNRTLARASSSTSTDLQNYTTPPKGSPPAPPVSPQPADSPVENQGALIEPVEPPKADPLADLWEQVNAIRTAAGGRAWKLNAPRRSQLRGRVKESSAEAVLSVMRWFHESPDAQWNRDNWKTPADTLLRARKFQGYLERSEAQEQLSAAEPAPTPLEAWERIVAALESPYARVCPCEESGWLLWPVSKDARVHPAMMAALEAATGQDCAPYAWQMVLQARQNGPDSYDLNQIGRAFRRAYPEALRTACALEAK